MNGNTDFDMARDELNAQGKEIAFEEAERMRDKVIQFGHTAIKAFARIDQITQRRLDNGRLTQGDVFKFFVQEEMVSIFMEGDKLVRVFTLLLEPDFDDAAVEEETARESEDTKVAKKGLRILMPAANDVELRGQYDLEDLPESDALYIEYIMEDGSITRHAVTKQELFDYESAYDGGEQVIKDEFHPDNFWRLVTTRLDSGLPFLTSLYEDFVNMRTIPQSEQIVGGWHLINQFANITTES